MFTPCSKNSLISCIKVVCFHKTSLFTAIRKKLLVFSFVFLFQFCYSELYSQTWTGNTSTAWEDATNWSTGLIPTSATDATIPASPAGGRFPTISSGTYGVKDIIIAAGATVTQTGGTLQVTNEWKNSGTYNATAGTVQFIGNGGGATNFAAGTNNLYHVIINTAVDPNFDNVASSNINVAGDFTNNNASLPAQNSNTTITFTGSSDQFFYTASANAICGALIINKSSGTVSQASAIKVTNLTLTAGTYSTGAANYNFTTTGTATINGGVFNTNASTITITGTMTANGGTVSGGNCAITTGDYVRNANVLAAPTGTLTVTGNWTSAATGTESIASVTFTGALKTIGGTTSTSFPSLQITGTITMNNSNSCTSLVFPVIATDASLTLAVGVTVNISGDITLNHPSADKDILLNINSATVNVTGNVNLGGNIADNGRFAKIILTTGTLDIAGNLVFNAASGLNGTSVVDMTGGAGLLKIQGNFVLTNGAGSLLPGTTSTVEFYGAAAQNIFGSGTISFNHIKINKTSGTVTQTSAVTANGNLQIDQGGYSTAASNYSLSVGSFILNGGTLNFNASTVSASGNYTNSGCTVGGSGSTVTISGDVTRNSGTYNDASGTLTVGGNWVNNNSSAFNVSSVTFTGTAKTISGTSSPALPAIIITTGTITSNVNLSCTGLTLTNNAVANSFTLANGITLTVNGNVTINQAVATVIHAFNVNGGTATVSGDLTINVTANNSGRLARVIITTGTLTINGNLNINNTVFAANGVIDMSGGAGNLNLYGNFTVNTLATLTPGTSSTVSFLGSGSQSIASGATITYNNLVINKTSGTASLTAPLTVNNVTITQGTFSVGVGNHLITLGGNWTNNGGTFSPGTGDVLLNGTGNIGGTGTTNFYDINLSSSSTGYTMSNNNSCNTLVFDPSASSTNFTHTGSASLTVTGGVTINQPTATATESWNINAGSATVGGLINFAGTNNGSTRVGQIMITTGTLNANGGISFAANTAPASKVIDMSGGAGVLNLKGALTFGNLGGTLNAGTAGSIFNYADDVNAQTINFFPGGAYHNLHINTTGSTGAVLSAAVTTTNVTGNIRIQSGTLGNAAFAIALNNSKTFEVANGATFRMNGSTGMVTGTSITKTFGTGSTCDYNGTVQTISSENYGNLTISGARTTNNVTLANSGTIAIAGTFTASATFTSGTYVITGSAVHFNGSSIQNIPAFTFNNLEVSGSAKTATGLISVNGSFTLNSTVLTTTAANLLVINDNATASGASLTAYVSGPVKKIGNDAFTFPVGKSGSGYMPISISAPSSVTDAFTAEYQRSSATALGSITAPGLIRVSNCDYWDLNRVAGSSTVNVTLSWNGYSNCNIAAYINNLASLTIAHFNGANWDSHGVSSTTGNASSGTITRNAVSVFSPFSLGSTDDYSNPLQVQFTSVKAYRKETGVNVEWTNLDESGIQGYDIERSYNGTDFKKIGHLDASYNNNITASYGWFDSETLVHTNYYRIKAIDNSGRSVYSNIVKITATEETDFRLYPVPLTTGNLSIHSPALKKGNYRFRIFNINGSEVFNIYYFHPGGLFNHPLHLPQPLNKGVYHLQVLSGNNLVFQKQLLLQ